MHQLGNIVLGVEGEWNWTELKGNATSAASPNPSANLAYTVNDGFSVKTKWTADATTGV
jgi:hypothetical protein